MDEVLKAQRDAHQARGTVITVELPPQCPFEVREQLFDAIDALVSEAQDGWDVFVTATAARPIGAAQEQ